MLQSQPKRKIRRKGSKGVSRSVTNKPWLLASILRPQKRKKRSVIPQKSCVIIVIRKATVPAITPSQKLALVTTISVPVTDGDKEVVRMLYIYYPI